MEMNTELVCVIANLGYNDGDEYFKSIDCLESLKDMVRFLRHDDLQTCDIRRQIGSSKVLQNDLIPLLVSNPEDKWLTDILLRLLVNLTSPPHLCFEQNAVEEVTNDSSERKAHEMEIMSYLLEYKEAFTQKFAMSVISNHLASILKKDVVDRDEDDDLFLERILLLIRNLLYVPADPDAEKRTDDDVSIHDQLLWSLHENGIDDLLIYISSSEDERNWCMHVCEIISHMFREQNAEELAMASEMRSVKEKEEDTKTLKAIFEKERGDKEKVLQCRGSRHSRFGGAFWVKGRSAINEDQHLVYHRTLQSARDMSYDFDKVPERKRKTKRALNEPDMERKSTLSIRLFLKEFCIKFLHNGYNILLAAVKSSINSGKTQKNDESFYLSVMRFFMAFNRVYDFRVEYVSQTISVQMFSDTLKLILKYDDQYCIIKPTKGKEKKIQFSRRIHLALRALKELLLYVAVMLKANDENLVAVADVIQSNIFYIEEYRNVFLDLLRHWNPAFQTRSYLKDVIESFHLYLKLFESFLKDKGTFLTKKKSVKRKGQVPKRKRDVPVRCPIEITEEQAEHLWQSEISILLSACIQGRDGGIPDDTILPFDLDSDLPDEEQILNAFATIQILLKRRQPQEAIAFLRASRECWPDECKFGTQNMSGEEEFMCARTIFFMSIPPEILRNADSRLQTSQMQEDTQEDLDEEEVEEENGAVEVREKLFDLKKFLKGLAVPYVVESYCDMLKTYSHNKVHTNHCVIKMLTRIAVDLDMFPMLFQLSLFVTFKKILQDPKTESNKEVKSFARYIVRKFFDVYKTNPMVVVDLLFWKSSAECYEIVEGYGSLEKQRNEKISSDVGKWNFEEEQELLDLYHELKDEADVVEKVTKRLSEKGRTSKQVRSKLVRLRVLEKPKKRKGNEWTEEETEELRNLYEEFKSTNEPLTNIMQALTFSKSRKWIISRLLEIGLVEDRKELFSKRKKKSKNVENEVNENDDLIIDEGKESGYEGEGAGSTADENEEEEEDEFESLDNESAVNSSLSHILQKLVNEGFGSEIAWIRSRLVRVANERENTDEDEWQPVPLVPITDDHQSALSNKRFKLMLKRMGISPPTNEQEAFWRISKSLSPSEIRDFTRELESASKSVSSVSTQKKEKEKASLKKAVYNQEDESDDDVFEKFINGSKSHAEDEKSEKIDETEIEFDSNSLKDSDEFNGYFNDDSSDDSDGTMKKQDGHLEARSLKSLLVRGKRARRIAFSDDDDDDDDDLSMQLEGTERKRKKLKKIEESDEDDKEEEWTDRNNDITIEEVGNDEEMKKNEDSKVSVDNEESHGCSNSKIGNKICNGSEEVCNHIDEEAYEKPEEEKRYSVDSKNTAFEQITSKETNENSSGGSFVLEISMDEENSDD